MIIVSTPRPDGHPNRLSIEINSNSIDKPVTISGITNGALAMALSARRDLKLPKRTKATAIQMPKIVAIVAAHTAMSNDVPKADKSWSFSSKPAYHFSDAPDQTETNLPALKLKITMMMIGRYKMPKPSAPSDRTSPFIRPISLPPPALDWVFQPPHHARLDSGHR